MEKQQTQTPVSIYEMPDRKKMVRVRTLDEDFVIDPKHIDNGKCYQFADAMERLKELGLTTFNKKQAIVMAAYHDEINKAIEVLDGDKLNWEWSVSEYIANYAWYYNGHYGTVYIYFKFSTYQVRPIYKL